MANNAKRTYKSSFYHKAKVFASQLEAKISHFFLCMITHSSLAIEELPMPFKKALLKSPLQKKLIYKQKQQKQHQTTLHCLVKSLLIVKLRRLLIAVHKFFHCRRQHKDEIKGTRKHQPKEEGRREKGRKSKQESGYFQIKKRQPQLKIRCPKKQT